MDSLCDLFCCLWGLGLLIPLRPSSVLPLPRFDNPTGWGKCLPSLLIIVLWDWLFPDGAVPIL